MICLVMCQVSRVGWGSSARLVLRALKDEIGKMRETKREFTTCQQGGGSEQR